MRRVMQCRYYTAMDWNKSSKRNGPGMQPYQYAKTAAENLGVHDCVNRCIDVCMNGWVDGWMSENRGPGVYLCM